MSEYLIRTEDGDWPAIHKDRLAAVLTPPGSGCQVEPGWGDFRMRCGGAVLAFSGEDSGWQVVVEGEDQVDALTEALTERIAAEVGQPCYSVNLG
jgi:hypothetical protein